MVVRGVTFSSGSEYASLPAFVAMYGTKPRRGDLVESFGRLPSLHQVTSLDPSVSNLAGNLDQPHELSKA